MILQFRNEVKQNTGIRQTCEGKERKIISQIMFSTS